LVVDGLDLRLRACSWLVVDGLDLRLRA